MIVKIGDELYDSTLEPIMFILSESDKKNISNMDKEANQFCSYPQNYDIDKVKKFMVFDEELLNKAKKIMEKNKKEGSVSSKEVKEFKNLKREK